MHKINARSGNKPGAKLNLVESSYKYWTLGNFHLSLIKWTQRYRI